MEEKRSPRADHPHLPTLFPEIAPAGMGGKTGLPFPVLLLAALPTVLLPVVVGFTHSLDSDFTFTLPAGRKECFYQPMPLKASLEIEYQVSVEGDSAPFLWLRCTASSCLTRLETSGARPGR